MKILLRQLVIIITQISIFQLYEKACLILLLLIVYLIFSLQRRPYKNEKLNFIDVSLNCVTIVMIIFTIYSSSITNTFK